MAFYEVDFVVKETIEAQLQNLLSTPKGTITLDPYYGLDFRFIDTDVGLIIDVQELKEDIREQLIRYVPRINAKKAKIGVSYDIKTGNIAIMVNQVTVNIAEDINVPRVRIT